MIFLVNFTCVTYANLQNNTMCAKTHKKITLFDALAELNLMLILTNSIYIDVSHYIVHHLICINI